MTNDMPEKELQNATNNSEWLLQIIPFCLAIGLSCVGGMVNYFNRIDKSGIAFNMFRLAMEITTSGFVGVISFMLCDAAGFGWSTTAAIVAISGHMGTRALFLIENATVGVVNNFMRKNGYVENTKDATKPDER